MDNGTGNEGPAHPSPNGNNAHQQDGTEAVINELTSVSITTASFSTVTACLESLPSASTTDEYGSQPPLINSAGGNADQQDTNLQSPSSSSLQELNIDDQVDELQAERGTTPPPALPFRSVLLQFIKTLATASTDLYQLSCPAIILNGISLLEYCIHWCDHPDLLAGMGAASTPCDRISAVVRWYLSSMYGGYASRSASGGFERKPYNPILGEQFNANWPDVGYGETRLCAEQVSHHPPITGFYLENAKAKVHVNGFSGQRTGFTGTAIKVDQTGRLFVYLEQHKEEYMITLPELYVRGILTGAPFVEVTGECLILSSSGYAARLNFIPKPWFGGEYCQMDGAIIDTTEDNAVKFELWGKWSTRVFIRPGTGANKSITDPAAAQGHGASILFDRESMPQCTPNVAPISRQDALESRKVWQDVTHNLRIGDYKKANDAKNAVEEEQRALRQERARLGQKWTPKYFEFHMISFIPSLGGDAGEKANGADDGGAEDGGLSESSAAHTNNSRTSLSSAVSSVDNRISSISARAADGSDDSYQGRWVHTSFSERFIPRGKAK